MENIMPIYEYECPKHGRFEMLRSLSESDLENCPICKSEVTRVMSAPGAFEFKGKGFYHTDYKKSGDAVSEKRSWPGDNKNNVVNLPKVDMFAQFDKRRAEERRKVKKQKDRKFIAK